MTVCKGSDVGALPEGHLLWYGGFAPDVWIIETKGGERNDYSDNIDNMSPVKFDVFKTYVS